jgi:NAD+ kinase
MLKKHKVFGIVTKNSIVEQKEVLQKIIKILAKNKKNILLDENAAPLINKEKGLSHEEIFSKCDFVIILGGDGTVLKSAACATKKIVPILTVNMGNLGFLTEINKDQIEQTLKKIINGEYEIDKRPLIRITRYRNNKKIDTYLALNDAVINQGLFARLIELEIEVDNTHAVSLKADGMIIATPTGSTAHSLSAGGPIVHPEVQSLILTPICPSTLSIRPVVIPNEKTITITIATKRRGDFNLGLTIDGQITVPLEYGDKLKIRKSSRLFHLAYFNQPDYFRLLRDKLGWGYAARK